MTAHLLVHATAVEIEGGAVLLRGPSGVGKSDLALRLVDAGCQLVADDQVELNRVGPRVFAAAPPPLAGLIEIRGVGILSVDRVARAPLVLIADLVRGEEVERLPELRHEMVLGVALPLLALAPFEASAAAKLRFARRTLGADAAHRL